MSDTNGNSLYTREQLKISLMRYYFNLDRSHVPPVPCHVTEHTDEWRVVMFLRSIYNFEVNNGIMFNLTELLGIIDDYDGTEKLDGKIKNYINLLIERLSDIELMDLVYVTGAKARKGKYVVTKRI